MENVIYGLIGLCFWLGLFWAIAAVFSHKKEKSVSSTAPVAELTVLPITAETVVKAAPAAKKKPYESLDLQTFMDFQQKAVSICSSASVDGVRLVIFGLPGGYYERIAIPTNGLSCRRLGDNDRIIFEPVVDAEKRLSVSKMMQTFEGEVSSLMKGKKFRFFDKKESSPALVGV